MVIAVICYIGISLLTALWVKRDTLKKATVIIVLEGPNKFLTLPRLKRAEYLYKKGYAPTILISGKKLIPWMEKFLENKGIPKNRIKRNKGTTNTYEDARATYAVIKNPKSIILVTSSNHQRRANKTFKKFFKNTKIINTPSHDYFNFFSPFLPTGWISAGIELVKYVKYN